MNGLRDYFRLLGYLRPFRGWIVLTWSLSCAVLLLQGISVWLAAGFIQRIIAGGPSREILSGWNLNAWLDRLVSGAIDQGNPFHTLLVATFLLLVMRLATSGLRFYKLFLFANINQSVIVTVREQLFQALSQIDLFFSLDKRPGELSAVVIQDANQLNYALIDAVDRAVMQPLRMALALVLMAAVNPALTVLCVCIITASGLLIHYSGKHTARLANSAMERSARLQGRLTEFLSVVFLARMFNRDQEECRRFYRDCQRLSRSNIRIMISHALAPEAVNVVFALGASALLICGGYAVFVNRTLSSTDLIKMLLILPMLAYPTEALASIFTSVRASLASARRVFRLMDSAAESVSDTGGRPVPPLSMGIELKGVCLSFSEQPVLQGVDLYIPAETKVLIQGPSGTGKTSILRLLCGFITPTDGRILIDATDMRSLSAASWRNQLGIVTQDPLLLLGSVRDNLKYAVPDADEETMVDVLKRVHLWPPHGNLPAGLDTQVGNRGERLSGGERQRLTIARALLRNPRVMMIDEPTTMLDHAAGRRVVDAIESASVGRTLILVTHDPELQSLADVVLEVRDRRLHMVRGDLGGASRAVAAMRPGTKPI